MSIYQDWALQVQRALLDAIREGCGAQWGYDGNENDGLLSDLVNKVEQLPEDLLQLEAYRVTETGIHIHLKPGKALHTLSEVADAVHQLLLYRPEKCFIFLPLLNEDSVNYWFVIGSPSHGHVGEIIIQRQDLAHMDFSLFHYNK